MAEWRSRQDSNLWPSAQKAGEALLLACHSLAGGLPLTASGAMIGSFTAFEGLEEVLAAEGAGPGQRAHAGGLPGPGGRGSHRNFVHPRVRKPVTLSGQPGDDALRYQNRAVRLAIEESKR